MATISEFPFQSLTDQIVERLTNDILTAVYLPGERLKESEIAAHMGVSRAPLREAFRVLERNGLIEIKPWKGASVVEPKRSEIEELFDARAELFAICARYLATQGTHENIASVRKEIDVLVADTEAGIDERGYKKHTNHISILMSQGMHNRYLQDIMTNLRQKMFWYYCHLGTSTITRRKESNRLWQQLSQALLGRDAQAAAAAAYEIMAASKRFSLALLDESDKLNKTAS